MDCKAAKNDLGRYVDEELSASSRAALESHLNSCAACAAELETLRSMATELSSDSSVDVPRPRDFESEAGPIALLRLRRDE